MRKYTRMLIGFCLTTQESLLVRKIIAEVVWLYNKVICCDEKQCWARHGHSHLSPSTMEAGAGGARVQGWPKPHSSRLIWDSPPTTPSLKSCDLGDVKYTNSHWIFRSNTQLNPNNNVVSFPPQEFASMPFSLLLLKGLTHVGAGLSDYPCPSFTLSSSVFSAKKATCLCSCCACRLYLSRDDVWTGIVQLLSTAEREFIGFLPSLTDEQCGNGHPLMARMPRGVFIQATATVATEV